MRLSLFVVAALMALNLFAAEPKKVDLPGGAHYLLVLPAGHNPKQSYDAVVALHGAGDTAPNYASFFGGMVSGRSTVLAVPEAGVAMGPGFTWNSATDVQRVVDTVNDLVKNHGVDPKRVLLTGHSAGCFFGFSLIAKHPELFACFGGTAAGLVRVSEKEIAKAADKVAVYYGCGKQDPNYQLFKPTCDLLNKLKFNLLADDPDIGHTIVPEQVKKMLSHFDAACDKAGQAKLAAAKQLLAAKNWAQAEKELTGAAAGQSAPAKEAQALLENLKKDFADKLEAARALGGPKAIDALKKLEREYPNTSVAADAKAAAAAIAADPKTAELGAAQRREEREGKAKTALDAAAALEKSGKLMMAAAAYDRIAADYVGVPTAAEAEAAAKRLKADPKFIAQQGSAEAESKLRMAENLVKNGRAEQAKDIYDEIVSKYPDSAPAKRAKEQLEKLK